MSPTSRRGRVSGASADKARAVIGQALVIGNAGTGTLNGVDQKAIPEEDHQPKDLLAVAAGPMALERFESLRSTIELYARLANQAYKLANLEHRMKHAEEVQ